MPTLVGAPKKSRGGASAGVPRQGEKRFGSADTGKREANADCRATTPFPPALSRSSNALQPPRRVLWRGAPQGVLHNTGNLRSAKAIGFQGCLSGPMCNNAQFMGRREWLIQFAGTVFQRIPCLRCKARRGTGNVQFKANLSALEAGKHERSATAAGLHQSLALSPAWPAVASLAWLINNVDLQHFSCALRVARCSAPGKCPEVNAQPYIGCFCAVRETDNCKSAPLTPLLRSEGTTPPRDVQTEGSH